MTTIAYKGGIIAYDSRLCDGDIIVDDSAVKHIEKDSVHFFFAGSTSGEQFLINSYFSKETPKNYKSLDIIAIICDTKKLFRASFNEAEGYWCCPERLGNPISIGSGSPYALTAMDMGATAEQAVKMAMKRDMRTGGRIRVFKLK